MLLRTYLYSAFKNVFRELFEQCCRQRWVSIQFLGIRNTRTNATCLSWRVRRYIRYGRKRRGGSAHKRSAVDGAWATMISFFPPRSSRKQRVRSNIQSCGRITSLKRRSRTHGVATPTVVIYVYDSLKPHWIFVSETSFRRGL